MRKIIYLSLLIILTNYNVIAQTNVSGPYFLDTTWTISGSPYNLIGDVQIESNITLTIEPGVQVNFNSDFEILVKGVIIANGTNDSNIIFNGNISGGAMIMFKSTNLNNSQISNIKFYGPKIAIQLADETSDNQDSPKNSGELIISNAFFSNTKIRTKGYDSYAILRINDSEIISSEITGMYPRSENIILTNCSIDNSIINSDSYNYGIIINECTVENSDLKIGCCDANLELNNTELLNSNIIEGSGEPIAGPVKITNCLLNNTPLNLPYAKVEFQESSINYSSANGLIFGNGKFECSQIIGDNSGTAIKITGYNGYYLSGSTSFINSTIKNNLIGLKISNTNSFTIDSCNIYNNSNFNIVNLSSKNITANHCWWGSVNTTSINNSIYDYYDDINLGNIDYTDFLSEIKDISFCSEYISSDMYDINNNSDYYSVFPNPFKSTVNINLNDLTNVSLNVYNSVGQKVYTDKNINNSIYQLQLKQKAGIYILEIEADNIKRYFKLIKK